MTTTDIISGKDISGRIKDEIAAQVTELNTRDIFPTLAVILVGDDPASHVYVGNKIKACERTGIRSIEKKLDADVSKDELLSVIAELNDDPAVHGVLLQLPLPEALQPYTNEMIDAISPDKDVDGLHPLNAGRLVAELDGMVPCTPQGSLILIKEKCADLSGKHAVVIGRSLLFGKPMAQLLLQQNCTVTMCHSRTQALPAMCRQADILVAAVGRPKMVKKDWVKDGAIVIDVGINRQENGKLCGDVDFDDVQGTAGAMTPVPGGVGPMTITCLLQNTVKAAIKAA